MKRDTFDGNFFSMVLLYCSARVIGNWSRRGGASVRNVAIRSRTARVEYKRTRWTQRMTHKVHTELVLFVDGKKMQLKIFQVIWVTDCSSTVDPFVRFCALRSIDSKESQRAVRFEHWQYVVCNLCSMLGNFNCSSEQDSNFIKTRKVCKFNS